MRGLTCKTALLAAALAAAGLVSGCFDSYCPDGTAECASGGDGGGGGGGGGGDGGDDRTVRELCIETCEKSQECFGGGFGDDCELSCEDADIGMDCSNEEELFDALERCNEGPCGPMGSEYSSCLGAVPPCE